MSLVIAEIALTVIGIAGFVLHAWQQNAGFGITPEEESQ